MEEAIEIFNPEKEMYAIFDYVRIRFPSHNHEEIIRRIMWIQPEFFINEPYGFYGYREQYVLSDIVVMVSDEDDPRGTLLELKGEGCRRFEYFLQAQKRTWNDFFIAAFSVEGVIKRLDIAINDTAGILSIPELMRKAGTDECKTIFNKFQKISASEKVYHETLDGKMGEGNTLYVGSTRSDVYFCIYEKDYEQYVKKGIPVEDAEVKNRFEIRLKDDRAYAAIADLIENEDIEKTAFEIINRYLCFYEQDKNKKPEDWIMDFRWGCFIGQCRGKLKLTMKPEPYTVHKTYRWITNQVAGSLALLQKLDVLEGTSFVADLQNVKLPDKQRKIFEQCAANAEQLVLERGLNPEEMVATGIDKEDIKIPERRKTSVELMDEVQKLKDELYQEKLKSEKMRKAFEDPQLKFDIGGGA